MTNWQNVAEENKEEIMAEVKDALRYCSGLRRRGRRGAVEVHLFPDGQMETIYDTQAICLVSNDMYSAPIWWDDSGYAATPLNQLWDEVLANVKKLDREQACI